MAVVIAAEAHEHAVAPGGFEDAEFASKRRTNGMLLLFIIPVLIWGVTADRWHPWMLGATVAIFAVYLATSLRSQMKQDARGRLFGQQGDYQWRREWPAASFKLQLDRYLRLRGWNILDAAAIGVNAVIIVVEMKRCRAALLCLRPAQLPTQEALDTLAVLRRSTGASRTVVVSQRRIKLPDYGAASGAELMQVPFSDIPKIEYILGLG